MATTRVNFSGMIGFVPKKPTEKYPGKAMRLLFVDATERNMGPMVSNQINGKLAFEDREHLFPHIPVVHFRLEDLAPESPRRPDLVGNGRGICFLKYEELQIGDLSENDGLEFDLNRLDPVGAATAGSVKGAHPHPDCAAQAAIAPMPHAEDLAWLLPLDVASGQPKNQAAVDPGCLVVDPQKNGPQDPGSYNVDPITLKAGDNHLAARTRLNRGRLYTRLFRTAGVGGQRRMALCDFFEPDAKKPDQPAPNGFKHSQCLATLVTWEAEEKSALGTGKEGLSIHSNEKHGFTFEGEPIPQRPVLRFKKPDDIGRDVEIHLWNATVPDLLSVIAVPGDDQVGFQSPRGDRSFRAFYRLLAAGSGMTAPIILRQKLVAAETLVTATEGGKGVGCPNGLYADHDLA